MGLLTSFFIVPSTLVDPRHVMLWRVVETCATQPPPFAEKRKKRVRSHDGGGPCSGVSHHGAFEEKAMR